MIVIIGGGPAGLSLAHHLERAYELVEREDEVGGLCRSFTLGDAVFDYGGHAYFTGHAHVTELIAATSPTSLYRQPRRAFVASHGTVVPYPFQSNLHGLPVEVVKECLVGAVETLQSSPAAPPSDLDQWIDRAFGSGVARHFLRPYNEKVWAHPLAEIVPSWVDDRIVQPRIADMIEGALHRRRYVDIPNATVAYPSTGGFAELYSGLGRAAAPNTRRGEVTLVDVHEQLVVTAAGETYPYGTLVSTMPLSELVRITRPRSERMCSLASSLAHNSLSLVNVVVGRTAITDMQRLYVADPTVPFHKLVFNSNSSPSLKSSKHFGIQAEVTYSSYKPLDRDGLEATVVAQLHNLGILGERDPIVATSTVDVRYAYPIATRAGQQAVAELRRHYAELGVHLLGRFGEWDYINSDEAVHRGMRLAEQLNDAEHAPSGVTRVRG
ncbi:MAG: protoporphyrinogen/coproporphyrinogen oxidase [Acidimicrobiia bacterium]